MATSADHKGKEWRKDKPQKVKDTQNLLEGKKRKKAITMMVCKVSSPKKL
jgi:hypothetical protein